MSQKNMKSSYNKVAAGGSPSLLQNSLVIEQISALQEKVSGLESQLKCMDLISFANVYKEKLVFPALKNPLVSIIIPVYNQYAYTKACLYTVFNTVKDIDYEIIVADDNSTDETKDILNDFENILVVRNKINLGFLLNVKNASDLCRGKFICLLNNDTLPSNDWLKYLLETMENHEDAGIVGSKYLDTNHLIAEAGVIMHKDGIPEVLAEHCAAEADDVRFNKERIVDYCSGCGILLRKDAWDKVGGFDELYAPAFYEDPDLSFMFKHKLGLNTYYQPKSEITHFHNISYQHSHHTAFPNKPKFLAKWAKELSSNLYS